LKQVVQVKESEAFLTINLGLYQNIVDDANHSFSISINGLQGIEIKVNNL
jgi:hypothetical protein